MEVAVKLAGRKEILPPVERIFAAALLKAFKELAGLSTHTVTTWQSGFASIPVGGGRRADLRVEVTPSVHGESLVARVQDRQLQLDRMRSLPFTDPRQVRLASALPPPGPGADRGDRGDRAGQDDDALRLSRPARPIGAEHTNPGGSGRIHRAMDHANPRGLRHRPRLRDGLKSLLRQAPHVILLGEIRDRSVAQICVEAVDTGHLIFATLHTRDAIGAVSRLIDLDLTGRQISAALTLAIGQRLVRRLCPHCRRQERPTLLQAAHFAQYRLPVPEILHAPGGCPHCGGLGERGVLPVFEFFHPAGDDALSDWIARASRESFNERKLRARWLERGGSPLVCEGLRLVAEGRVAHAEVLKFERNPPGC